jgi:hypothetical protein
MNWDIEINHQWSLFTPLGVNNGTKRTQAYNKTVGLTELSLSKRMKSLLEMNFL